MSHPVLLWQRVCAGIEDPEAVAWLYAGVITHKRAGGKIRLERCLHLPATPQACARLVRDLYLADAIGLLSGNAAELARQIKTRRHKFDAWHKRGGVPEGADSLDLLLYEAYAAVAPDSLPASAKQLGRIARDTDSAKHVPADGVGLTLLTKEQP